jgi:hypothetical protein
MIHQEIKCPYCRIQFGHYKIGKEVEHVDMLWTSEAGLIKTCQDSELVRANITSLDKNGNPKFNDDFQKKLNELRSKFETCPDDITKETFNADDYMIAFVECMNYGYVDGEDEDYDRENMTMPKIQQMWENGHNLNEALKAFIKKNDE